METSDGGFDVLQGGGFNKVLHCDSGTEMELAWFGMQKEITIDCEKVSSKGDVLVLCEYI